jgi:serine protease Do
MSVRSLNWLKFGGLVAVAFALGLLFAGLLDLPSRGVAQEVTPTHPTLNAIPSVTAQSTQATKMLTELSDAFAAVTERVRPSVVYIRSQRTERAGNGNPTPPPGWEQFFPRLPRHPDVERGSGSGFIVSPDGYVLTNNHVVEGADKVMVRLKDRREFDAKVVGTDPLTDVALLKIDANHLPAAALGNSDETRIGEWVLAVGNPLGEDFTLTVTSGIVSGKGRRLNGLLRSMASIADFIQTDAAINPGNSGGPLLNVRGEVIGINSAIASETGYYSGYGFAIPINLARNVMNQLIAGGKVHRAALGILVRDAGENDAEYVGMQDIRGVVVSDFPDSGPSPARQAGLQPGDVIISIDGQPVDYVAQLQTMVGFKKPGETVKVEVARKGGVRKTFDVRLIEQKTEPARLASANDSDNGNGGGKDAAPEAVSIDHLGITAQTVTPSVASDLELDREVHGVVVTEVDPNGPAYGVLSSPDEGGPDIIQSVEGRPVRTEAELRKDLQDAGKGSIVTLRVLNARQGTTGVVRVRLR